MKKIQITKHTFAAIGRRMLHRLSHQLVPNVGTLVMMALLFFAYHAWAAPSAAPQADVLASGVNTGLLSYQGYLTDASGEPLTGGVDITFRLYDAPSGGAALWTEAHTNVNAVPVEDGLFNVMLGSLTPISSTVWSSGASYLGVQVGDDAEMAPREVVGNVPTALTVPDGSITEDHLDFRVPHLLGYKTYDGANEPTETGLTAGWHPIKGINSQDTIEVTVTTHGGPVMVHMTARYRTDPKGDHWCSIYVYQDGTYLRRALLDGDEPSPDSQAYGCSGNYLFTDLPAGTYTFRANAFVRPTADVQWQRQRQIVVFEYESQ